MAGISPNIMIWVGPFNIFHSAFVHANLNWTLGPFRYVLATPVFHRWHHTSPAEGGNTNFAGTFPLWDILFGTANYDGKRRPTGVDNPIMDADNGRGWVAQQVTVFGRFVRALTPRFIRDSIQPGLRPPAE